MLKKILMKNRNNHRDDDTYDYEHYDGYGGYAGYDMDESMEFEDLQATLSSCTTIKTNDDSGDEDDDKNNSLVGKMTKPVRAMAMKIIAAPKNKNYNNRYNKGNSSRSQLLPPVSSLLSGCRRNATQSCIPQQQQQQQKYRQDLPSTLSSLDLEALMENGGEEFFHEMGLNERDVAALILCKELDMIGDMDG